MPKYRPVDPRKDGAELADAISAKLGHHEGSEGHPINFERSGEFHRYIGRYVFDDHRDQFIEGYRARWKAILGNCS